MYRARVVEFFHLDEACPHVKVGSSEEVKDRAEYQRLDGHLNFVYKSGFQEDGVHLLTSRQGGLLVAARLQLRYDFLRRRAGVLDLAGDVCFVLGGRGDYDVEPTGQGRRESLEGVVPH